ncbi:hypothetical protein [Actinomadura physcomitrii]|uniref:hypothetical protein n=1 Tax=Actinomadura physcomitrii TaxID=2650748 RepID=UPI001F489F0A|nr:hypothetical protein [Actinomadura physcomitrii]
MASIAEAGFEPFRPGMTPVEKPKNVPAIPAAMMIESVAEVAANENFIGFSECRASSVVPLSQLGGAAVRHR